MKKQLLPKIMKEVKVFKNSKNWKHKYYFEFRQNISFLYKSGHSFRNEFLWLSARVTAVIHSSIDRKGFQ